MNGNSELDFPSVSVVVLSHDRLDELQKNLPTLLQADKAVLKEIIIVDNASIDGSVEWLRSFALSDPRINVQFNVENRGAAGGKNVGYRLASGDYVVSLDDDTHINPEDIERIPALFARFPESGILAFRIRNPVTGQWQNDYGEAPCRLANHHNAGCAIRRRVFDLVGYVDERCTFGAGGLDLCIRAHSVGLGAFFMPDLIVDHNNILRTGSEGIRRRELRIYNNVRTHHKYFPWSRAIVFNFRYVVPYFLAGFLLYKGSIIIPFARAMIRGYVDGRRSHIKLPKSTIDFYSQKDLKPDFGNAPMNFFVRAIRKLRLSS